jgi:hypothetical protein
MAGLLDFIALAQDTSAAKRQRRTDEEIERIRRLRIAAATETDPDLKAKISQDLSAAESAYATDDLKPHRGLASAILHNLGSGFLDTLGIMGRDPRIQDQIPLGVPPGAGTTGGLNAQTPLPGLLQALAGIGPQAPQPPQALPTPNLAAQFAFPGAGGPAAEAGRYGMMARPEDVAAAAAATPATGGLPTPGLLARLAFPGGAAPAPTPSRNLLPTGLGAAPSQLAFDPPELAQAEAARNLPLSTFGRANIRVTPAQLAGQKPIAGMVPLPPETVGRAKFMLQAAGPEFSQAMDQIDLAQRMKWLSPEQADEARQQILLGRPPAAARVTEYEQTRQDLIQAWQEENPGKKMSARERAQIDKEARTSSASGGLVGEAKDLQWAKGVKANPENFSESDQAVADDIITKWEQGEKGRESLIKAREEQTQKLPEQTAEFWAERFLLTGQMPQGATRALGRTAMQQIMAVIPDVAQKEGLSVGGMVAQQADIGALRKALGTMETQYRVTSSFEKTAQANLDRAIQAAQKIGDTGSPIFTRPYREIQKELQGKPELAAYEAARVAAISEVSKVLSGSMGNGAVSDHAREEASNLLNSGYTLAQLVAAAQMLKLDMESRTSNMKETIEGIQEQIAGPSPARGGAGAGGGASRSGAGASGAGQGGAPKRGDRQTYQGRTYVFDGSQWVRQ